MTVPDDPGDADAVTRILRAASADSGVDFDRLLPLVQQRLRQLSRRERRRVSGNDTLGTTALVNEAYLRLHRNDRWRWQDRNHFFATAAKAMRQILVDHARSRLAAKRGAGEPVESLDNHEPAHAERDDALLLDIHAGLDALERLNPRLSRVVECLYFAGYTESETAELLGVTDRTVRRDWAKARAWLYRHLHDDD